MKKQSTSLENTPVKYSDLISEIRTGQVKIPQFQRKFVWDINASAKLLDSIIKGYPIGTFIYWRTNERLRSIRNLGNIELPEPRKGEFVNYVLDGQQRLTSLFAALKGLVIKDENGRESDYSKMYINFEAKEDEDIVTTEPSKLEPKTYIKIKDLMEGGLSLLASYPQEYHGLIEKYKGIIQSYTFAIINLKNAPIDVATEVFTRLNVGGRALTLFEIMVAKTYDVERNFDLAEKYEELKEELRASQYDTIPSATVLQAVSIILKKDCTRRQILKLEKDEFIDIWDEAVNCIKQSIDFFRSYGILVSRILPYNALIVPFSYYFYLNKTAPTGLVKDRLVDFFWRASLGYRYSSGVESKLAQDIEKIESIVKGNLPRYEWAVTLDAEYIKNNGWFGTGRAFIKAILCLYVRKTPQSFDNNLRVIVDNSWLKIASSKNYHHFFPKAWMKNNRKEWEYHLVNHIANITIVDDFLNKRRIGAKAPSEYMLEFRKENSNLEETMLSHHYIDLEADGIWDNDYDKFFHNRIKRIVKELNEEIIPQEETEIVEIYEDVEVLIEDYE